MCRGKAESVVYDKTIKLTNILVRLSIYSNRLIHSNNNNHLSMESVIFKTNYWTIALF